MDLYLKRYDNGYDIKTDCDYNRWSSLMDDIKQLAPALTPPQPSAKTAEPQPTSMQLTIDEVLTMPSCSKNKGVKRSQPPMPSSISGNDFKQMLLPKKRKVEEEQQQKEERKRQREERKKRKLAQAEEKKKRQEEKKKEREQEKKEKEEKKKRMVQEKKANDAATKKTKKEEEDSSDSGEEPVYDDTSDACEDITDDCDGCGATTRGQVRTRCTLCDKWWHAHCVTHMDLKDKTQEDLDAMDVQFFCCVDSLFAM